ncbi:MAG: hypothetical protein QM767_07865 [Anaeromyxobacter sp.]
MPPAFHRPYRTLAAACILLALIPVALAQTVPSPAQLAGAYAGWALACYMAAAISAAQVAVTFDGGDLQRAGWGLLAGAFLVLFLARLSAPPNPFKLYDGPAPAPALVSIASIISSSLAAAGYLVLALAWHRSGLDDASPRRRWVSALGGLGVAAALAGPDLVQQLPAALRGDPPPPPT